MEHSGERPAMAAPPQSSLARCRIAACGGICGAVIVPGAMLALYYFLQVEQPVDKLSVVITVAIAALGVALMLLAGRVAGRPQSRSGALAVRLPLAAESGEEAVLHQ